MELYLHIPFCIRKCDYCDFLSMSAEESLKSKYMSALLKEIATYRSLSLEYEVVTIFIGGGTPSCVNAKELQTVLEKIYEVFEITNRHELEITMEANPGTLTKEKLAIYQLAGINRISIGLQSTNGEELRALGRIHTYEQFLVSYDLAKQAGFTNINIDLMSALPGQTVKSYEETLKKILALDPAHISAYSLIIEESTPFYQRYHEGGSLEYLLPGEDSDRLMYHLTKTMLQEHGYYRYEISNYAKASYPCKHNIGYWNGTQYQGIGLGAASYLKNQRFHNEENLSTYLKAIEARENIRRDVVTLSRKERMEEFMFLGLRLTEGINLISFQSEFGVSIESVYGNIIQKMSSQGLLETSKDNLRLTEEGLDVSNYVMAEFLLEE